MENEQTPTLTPARKRAIAIAAAALAAAVAGTLLVVARGGDASTGVAAGPGGGGAPFAAGGYGFGPPRAANGSFDSFRQCLERNGVTPPDPSQGRPNFDDSTMRKAFEACRQYLPARGSRDDDHGFGGPPGSVPPSQDDGTGDGPTT